MSVFGSIFGKNRSGKGSLWLFGGNAFPPAVRRSRRISAQPETEHHIGGSPARAPSPRRWGQQDGMGHFPFSPTAPKKFGSAATWCKANGMHLATMYEACPDWDGTYGNGYPCPISGSSIGSDEHVWTATVSGEGYAYFVNPVSGYVSTLSRSYPGAYALCAN